MTTSLDPAALDAWITREASFEPVEIGQSEWEDDEDLQVDIPFDNATCPSCGVGIGMDLGRDTTNPDVDAFRWNAPWLCADEEYRCDDCANPAEVDIDSDNPDTRREA